MHRLKASLLLILFNRVTEASYPDIIFLFAFWEGKLAEPWVTVGSSKHIKSLSYPSVRAYSSLTFQGTWLKRRGSETCWVASSWEFGMHLWRRTLSLAQNFQENSVGGKEKQCNAMTPCRARFGLAESPRDCIPAALPWPNVPVNKEGTGWTDLRSGYPGASKIEPRGLAGWGPSCGSCLFSFPGSGRHTHTSYWHTYTHSRFQWDLDEFPKLRWSLVQWSGTGDLLLGHFPISPEQESVQRRHWPQAEPGHWRMGPLSKQYFRLPEGQTEWQPSSTVTRSTSPIWFHGIKQLTDDPVIPRASPPLPASPHTLLFSPVSISSPPASRWALVVVRGA